MRLGIIGSLFLIVLFFGSLPTNASSNDQLIIINKSINKLAYFNNGELVKTFDIATGRTSTLTPEGNFKIVNKIKNRPYYTDSIPGGDPRNPLGDRWLGLNARGTWGTTYAIHGNNNSNSIGKYVSAGCVRMYNNEVRWLFEQVKVNTPVVITSSSLSFKDLAKKNGYQLKPNCVVCWDDMELKPGQIGRITINEPINLWKRDENNELQFERILQPGERYRVYRFDSLYGGQYGLGGGYYVTNMPEFIKYETPSKRLLEQLEGSQKEDDSSEEGSNDEDSSNTPVNCEGVCWDGMELKPGQIGRVIIEKPINLWKRDEENNLHFERILQPGEIYRVYRYDEMHGGQYGLGGGYYVTKIEGYIKYETPSSQLLEELQPN